MSSNSITRRSLLSSVAFLAVLSVAQAQVPATGAGRGVPAVAGGSVAFDAVASTSVSGTGGLNTLSWTHTPVGTPTGVAVCFENYTGVGTVIGVTYGGNAMALAVAKAITGQSTDVEIWGLANPPSGAQTVVITFSGVNPFCSAGSVTVTGGNTTTVFTASNAVEGNSTTPSVAVTSNVNELIVDIVGGTFQAVTETAGGSQTKRWGPLTAATTNVASGSTLPASATSTTMSWTLSPGTTWGHAAASFKA